MLVLSLFLTFVSLFNFFPHAGAQNITVSSSSSELQYTPDVGQWTSSDRCPSGYHYISQIGASVSFQFTGVAVYVVSSRERPGGLLQVKIDGKDAGTADRFADLEVETCGFVVFAQENLPLGPHQITLTHQGPSPSAREIGYIAIQRFIYTATPPPTLPYPPSLPPSSIIPTPTSLLNGGGSAPQKPPFPWKLIAAAVAAGLLVAALGIGAWILIRRRRSRRKLDRRVSLATLGAPMGGNLPADPYSVINPYNLPAGQANGTTPAPQSAYIYPPTPRAAPDTPTQPFSPPPLSTVSSSDISKQKLHYPASQWGSSSIPPEKSEASFTTNNPDAYNPPMALSEPDVLRIANAVARMTHASNPAPSVAQPYTQVSPFADPAATEAGLQVNTNVVQLQSAQYQPSQPAANDPDQGPAPPAYSEHLHSR